MAETDKIDKLFEMLSEMKGQMDVIMTQINGMKEQMESMNGKLAQISKDTDLKINNLSNKVNKENDEIKAQIKSVSQNNVLEEVCKALYVHNADALTGVIGPNKGNLLRWAEGTGLGKHLADIMTFKRHIQSLFHVCNFKTEGWAGQRTQGEKTGNCPCRCHPNQTKTNLDRSLHPTTVW